MRNRDGFNIGVLAVAFAGLPMDLAVSGALLIVVAFIAYMFDAERMLSAHLTPPAQDELQPSAESRSKAP